MAFLEEFADKWSSPRAMAKYGIALVEGNCIKKDEAKGLSYMFRAMDDRRSNAYVLMLLANEFSRIGSCMLPSAFNCLRRAALLGDHYALSIVRLAKQRFSDVETNNV
jgi:TPR repeat protein